MRGRKMKNLHLPRIMWKIKPFDRIHEKHKARVNEKANFKKFLTNIDIEFDEEFYRLIREHPNKTSL